MLRSLWLFFIAPSVFKDSRIFHKKLHSPLNMSGWIEKNSPFSVIIRCFKANKILHILVPTTLAVIAFSSYLNILATSSFSGANALFSSSEYQMGFQSFKWSLFIVFTRCFFSQLSEFISKIYSLVVFKAFLCESTCKHTQVDYTE